MRGWIVTVPYTLKTEDEILSVKLSLHYQEFSTIKGCVLFNVIV